MPYFWTSFYKVHFKKEFKNTVIALTYLNLQAFKLNFPELSQLISLDKTQNQSFVFKLSELEVTFGNDS